ncbi:MAG TPA: COX15/CtaA family protein [Longimicrobiales bacterium]
MPVQTVAGTGGTEVQDAVRRRFARLTAFAAVYCYLLVVFGGIVRITGSGLGCGDDWPLCNGRLIPPADLATWIEWTHRLLAAGLIFPIALVAVTAIRHRRGALGGATGAATPALVALVLLGVQVVLGAITVKLDLPAGITALHFVNALVMLGALVLAAVRASGGRPGSDDPAADRKHARAATVAAALGLAVVTFGALTANTGLVGAQTEPSAAAWACQGFPLCNGSIMPAGGSLVHIHWTHRVLAYLLFFHVIGAAVAAVRRGAPRAIRIGAGASLALVVTQVLVAAGLIHMSLPNGMRALHLVVGAALWMALVAWWAAAKARFPSRT